MSYSKNGGDLTHRFPTIAAAVLALPVRSCIIDGDLITGGVRTVMLGLAACVGAENLQGNYGLLLHGAGRS